MSLAEMLTGCRQLQESIMTDTVVITRPGTPATFNATDGTMIGGDRVTVYTGKARVQTASTNRNDATAGEQEVASVTTAVAVPADVTGVRKGDRVLVTASVSDPRMSGATVYVTSVEMSSFATARRLPCSLTQPGGDA